MFFQSPRPFGQHSTSYRSMSSGMHSSSSMTSLQVPEPKNGRASAPPISFASVYEGSRFGPSGPPLDQTSISSTNFEQTRISKESSDVVSPAELSTLDSKNYAKCKTTSLHDSPDSDGTSGQNLNVFQPEIHIPISKSSVFQVQRPSVNQQLPHWICQTQSRESQPEQTLQNVSSYCKEYHRSITSNQGNRFRSGSAVPFTEHSPKPVIMQVKPVPILGTGGYASMQSTHEQGGFSDARVRSSAQFNASQIALNEQQQQQKPTAYQQWERRKNYATLHHVTSPKMGPLQRRTSDPNLLKINGNDLPENIAMFNVAKGVRAELEQDPKFRRRADILSNRTVAEPTTGTFSSPTPLNKELPKQSPSLRQIESFFEHNVEQLHNVFGTKRPPPVPSAKPFNVEHVRSIFRTNNTVCTDSPPVATSISMDTQVKQDNPHLGEPIKLSIETHKAQEGTPHATLREDIRTSGIINRHIINTSQKTRPESGTGNLVEQKACSVSEIGKENTQAKPTALTFIVDKPVITAGTDKSPEMRKEITIQREQHILSQDIAVLEKDYDSLATFVIPRRLNQPFPVDSATFISGNEKTRNAASPLGILMKDGNGNDSGIKTPKKVAFQCDRDNISFMRNETEESKSK
uniref:Serine/threonine-protein kinase LATS2 n=1 Tax=Loa loa TaxID=7209 RepID=A0A1I7V813_LOALO